jgi:hypothetical protein
LDREIKKTTANAKTLADILKYLYARYGHMQRGHVTDAVIQSAVKEVTGKDLSGFFTTFIDQTTFLEMDAFFRDDDRDGLCNAGEDLLALRWDTDGDGANDGVEYRERTDPLSPASKPAGPV